MADLHECLLERTQRGCICRSVKHWSCLVRPWVELKQRNVRQKIIILWSTSITLHDYDHTCDSCIRKRCIDTKWLHSPLLQEFWFCFQNLITTSVLLNRLGTPPLVGIISSTTLTLKITVQHQLTNPLAHGVTSREDFLESDEFLQRFPWLTTIYWCCCSSSELICTFRLLWSIYEDFT